MAALIALLIALFGLGIWIGLTYNRLVAMRLSCESSWAQVDVALKLRHDLIPVLAESVAGYAGSEQRTLQEVAAARAKAMSGGWTYAAIHHTSLTSDLDGFSSGFTSQVAAQSSSSDGGLSGGGGGGFSGGGGGGWQPPPAEAP